ncbi:DNA repair protein xrcc4 [Mactra antiquata]
MNDCDFIRVLTTDNEECFLLTKLKRGGHEGLDLTLCHEGKVWTGSVSEDDLDELSARLKIQFTKYVKETVEALTNNAEGKNVYQYKLKVTKEGAKFSWKKHVPEEDITFQLGSATLKPHAESALVITRIYNHCIEGIQELKTRIHTLETDNQRLSQERMNALKRLEKCVVAKEELENDLYSKFCVVLNKKKEKIRELKQEALEGASTVRQDNPTASVSDAAVTNSKRPRAEVEKSEISDEDENTDDDAPKTKRSRPVASKKEDSFLDDSLLVDDEDPDSVQVSSRTRRQRGRGQKKQTPAKPVLPRIGSNDSTPGSERKSSLRKGASSASNKSSDSIETDDLFDKL